MKKYLTIILSIFIFVLPFWGIKAFAATSSLLDGQPMHFGTSVTSNGTLTNVLTDNNSNTSITYGVGNTAWYSFSSPKTINAVSCLTDGQAPMRFYFYDSSGTQIYYLDRASNGNLSGSIYTLPSAVPNVSKIAFSSAFGIGSTAVKEVNVYGDGPVTHTEIYNLATSTVNDTSINLSYTIPIGNTAFTGSKIYRNGTLIKTNGTGVNSYTDSSLTQYTTYSYKVTATYSDGFETSGSTIIATTGISHTEIPNFSVTANTFDSADLTWGIPQNNYLVGFNVYRDDLLIKSLDKTISSFKDTGLSEHSTHLYRISALYYDGGETSGITQTITTPFDPIIKDVLSAKITPISYKQINLSWTLSTQSRFKDIGIYREEKPKDPSFFSYVVSGTTAYAAEPTEIFQTNGTYFNDLTVKPDTSYVYTLKTETTDGSASEGVTLATETPSEPIPILTQDGKYSTTSTGDYVFKWTTPTIGTVKVLVGGKEYTTVAASTKQIAIPNKDMVNNIWGMPDVYLIPVGEFGTEGKKVYAGGVNSTFGSTLPFNPTDLIESGNGLLWIVAPFVLLALSFLLFPKFRKLIFTAFGRLRSIRKVEEKSETEERKFRTRKRERHEGKENLEKMKRQEKESKTQVKEPRIRETKESGITPGKKSREPRTRAERKAKEKKQFRQPREQKQPRERTRKPREPREPKGRRGQSKK